MTDPASINGSGFFHFNSNNDVSFTGATSGSFPFATQFPNTSFPVGPGTYDCIVSCSPSFNNAWTMTFNTTCSAVCTAPTVPTVSATPSSVCPGASATLNITGTLNDATAWHVYTGSCGGTQIGTTTTGTFNIPSVGSTTQYFVRGEGGCVTPGSCGSTTVTATDTTNPVITVCASTPANISANGSCQGTAPDLTGSVTATDNCTGSPTITQSPAAGATLGLGTTIITLTATDGSGNTAQCMVNQTVVDTTVPTTTCPADLLIECDADSSPANTGTATATDNCDANPVITFSDVVTAGVGNNSSIARTWTATDTNGNSSNCIQTITITDTTAPVLDLVMLTTVTAECSVIVSVTPTATDNCAGTIIGTTTDPLTYNSQGNFTITWNYEDDNGNTSTQTQNVVITDVTFPTALTQNITVSLDDSGEGSILPSDIDNGSSDNCSFTLSIDIDTFDCFNIGDYTVELSVEDAGGNISTATAIVTIIGDDNDNDTIVDACDDDDDNDGVLDIDDNCPWISNTDQIDLDQDNIGDSCDDFVDIVVTPNDTITPNGDGINDTWYIENIWRYPNAIIKVFNRHGAKVFEDRNYNNDWNVVSTEGGSGTLPANSYYFTIDLNQPEFGAYGVTPITGWFYINY
jgi:gliding motility-associated-like protein